LKQLAIGCRWLSHRRYGLGAFYGQDPDGSPLARADRPGALEQDSGGAAAENDRTVLSSGLDIDLDTMYSAERSQELGVLCDPRVREAIARMEIKLCSFQEIRVS
jgi:hypothetical protein